MLVGASRVALEELVGNYHDSILPHFDELNVGVVEVLLPCL
jgi:hypothetical protein